MIKRDLTPIVVKFGKFCLMRQNPITFKFWGIREPTSMPGKLETLNDDGSNNICTELKRPDLMVSSHSLCKAQKGRQ